MKQYVYHMRAGIESNRIVVLPMRKVSVGWFQIRDYLVCTAGHQYYNDVLISHISIKPSVPAH